jgi:hypothetical protein
MRISRLNKSRKQLTGGARPIPLLLTLALAFHAPAQIATSQYDNARTGAYLAETVLTPENVNPARFGKIGALRVDGDVYAQPLFLAGVNIPGKGPRNVIFVATEHDSVYAFDADLRDSAPLWRVRTPGRAHSLSPRWTCNAPSFIPRSASRRRR